MIEKTFKAVMSGMVYTTPFFDGEGGCWENEIIDDNSSRGVALVLPILTAELPWTKEETSTHRWTFEN